MENSQQSISLTFLSNQRFTEMAILVLNFLRNLLDIDEDEYFKIEISTREAINNAIVHGNHLDMNKKVLVLFNWENNRLRIEVQDENLDETTFDRIESTINSCDLLSAHGRGITIMRNYMDRFEFVCTGFGNRVILEKKLS